MLNKYAIHLTNKLCKSISLTNDEKEKYVYGFEITISTLIAMLSIAFISVLFDNILYSVLFIIFFYSIRLFCGGYHASSYLKCFILTNSIFVSTILLSKLVIKFDLKQIVILLVIFSSILIFLFSPVKNKNHPHSKERYIKFKIISKVLTIVYTLSYFLLFFHIGSEQIVIQAAWSYTWVSILILIEIIKQKGGIKNAFFHYSNSFDR